MSRGLGDVYKRQDLGAWASEDRKIAGEKVFLPEEEDHDTMH